MKSLNNIINEALTEKQNDVLGEFFITLITHSKVSTTVLEGMMSNLKMSHIQEICKYLDKTARKEAFAYLPTEDDFLKEENKPRIIENLSKYLFNIAN